MKVGVIARADDRGLGNQTWEVARNLHPDRVLVVDVPSSRQQGFEPHFDRFPGATIVTDHSGVLPEPTVREWLSGLDVVYTAESVYDVRLPEWADDQQVGVVIHGNPEFYRHRDAPSPTGWWSATDWRLEHMPPGTRVVPMPVPIDRFPAPDFDTSPRRVLHVGGRAATGDRNGTRIASATAGLLSRCEVVVTSQSNIAPDGPVTLVRPEGDYWSMYDGFSVLLLPRRYGGLCLPVNEACAAGLVPVMPDCSPNQWWPIVPLPVHSTRKTVTCPGGIIESQDVHPKDAAAVVQRLLDSEELPDLRRRARAWAEAHSWEALAPMWGDELARVATDAKKPRTRRRVAQVETIIPFRGGCPHREAALAWVTARHDMPRVVRANDGPWVKARAVNPAMAESTADVLVISDADVWCEELPAAVDHVRTHGGWAVPHRLVHRLTEHATRLLLEEPDVLLGDVVGTIEEAPYKGIIGGGLVVISRQLAEEVPLDPRFVGWGGEDVSWGRALETLGGKPWRGHAPLIHLWHPPQHREGRGGMAVDSQELMRRYEKAMRDVRRMRHLITEARTA